MKQYDYILLDWDGNIAKTLDLWIAAQDEVLQKRGIQLTRQQLIESCKGFVAYTTKHSSITTAEATKALNEATAIVSTNLPNIELYPGTIDTLLKLKSGGKHLALITTSKRYLIEPLLQKYNISDLFEAVICIEDVAFERRKPHPESLELALKKMGGTPDKAIMIGDRDKDILAGRNAGMDSVLFYSVEHQQFYGLDEVMKSKPTYVISEFSDLTTLLLK